jgi:phage-related protein
MNFVSAKKQPADIDWRGNSLEVLSSWPPEVKQTLGFELRKVQNGEQPSDGSL